MDRDSLHTEGMKCDWKVQPHNTQAVEGKSGAASTTSLHSPQLSPDSSYRIRLDKKEMQIDISSM